MQEKTEYKIDVMGEKALMLLVTHILVNPILILVIIFLFDQLDIYYFTSAFSFVSLFFVVINVSVLFYRTKSFRFRKLNFILRFLVCWMFFILTSIEIHYSLIYYHHVELFWIINKSVIFYYFVLLPLISLAVVLVFKNRKIDAIENMDLIDEL